MRTENIDQEAFWNSEPGQNWVTHQSELDDLMAGVTDLLIRESVPRAGEAVLDVGCGGGATAFAFARAVGPSGHVLGIDISAPLLERAEELRHAANLPNVAFASGDAQCFAPPDGAFDLAISRFGVMFFDDPVAAFRNISGGLRPGGRIVFAAWAGPEHNPWFALPLEIAVERLGATQPAPLDAPGPMAFRDIARVVGLLQAAGLADCSGESVGVELLNPGGVGAAAELATRIGPVPRMLREKVGTAEDMVAIATEIERRFAPFAAADGARIPAEINLFRARRA